MARRTRLSGSSLTSPSNGSRVPVAATTRSSLAFGQDHDGAVGIEEAGGILGHLFDDSVQLDRLGQDIAELLQREELADAPVDLGRQLLGLILGLVAPARRERSAARAKVPTAPPTADHRQPPDPVLGPARHDTEQDRGDGVQGELPALARWRAA